MRRAGGRARGTPAGNDRRLLFVAANPSIDRLYEIDRLVPGAIHRPQVVLARPGGKGLNAARAALTLGGRVTAIGIVAGRAGEWIIERLAELGIDARVVSVAGETRTCISVLDRSTGILTELYEHGDTIRNDAWDKLEAAVIDELERGDVGALALAGSLLPGSPSDGYARIANIAALHGVPVVADTHGAALAGLLGARPSVVKVNAREAADATGLDVVDPVSAAAAGATLRTRGACDVVITLGVDGAVVAGAEGAVRLVPPGVKGLYPVGSGDAFLAGLVLGLVDGSSLVDAARLGMAAGIANAMIPGAGDLDRVVARRLISEVTAHPF